MNILSSPLAAVTAWPQAFVLGIAFVSAALLIAYVISLAFRYVRTPDMTDDPGLRDGPSPNTKTTITVNREALKEVLKEMGYPDLKGDKVAEVETALTRDYSALMKRIDEIAAEGRET